MAKFDIQKAIKDKLHKNWTFDELDRYEKIEILKYIKAKKKEYKIFDRRGYDILGNHFFAYQYELSDDSFPCLVKEKKDFESFNKFYEYTSGDIYNHACYFGYVFSNDEINNYNLDTSKLNFDAFIDYDIDDFTFEKVKRTRDENSFQCLSFEQAGKIARWYGKTEPIKTFDELKRKYSYFIGKYNFSSAGKVFFSLVMRKGNEETKKAVIDYFCKRGPTQELSFDTILIHFDKEAGEQVIEDLEKPNDLFISEHSIKTMRDTLEYYKSGDLKKQTESCFDSNLKLYHIETKLCNNDTVYLKTSDFFTSFDEFIQELDYNLCDCDLSNAPVEPDIISNCITNENTKFPVKETKPIYKIEKDFNGEQFEVNQYWYDLFGNLLIDDTETFDYICDFIHFLKNDLTHADLLLCENLRSLKMVKNINWEGALIQSNDAKKLNIPQEKIPKKLLKTQDFEQSGNNELSSIKTFLEIRQDEIDEGKKISYVSDIHLIHRFKANGCKTINDCKYVIKTITRSFNLPEIILIGGDISSDYSVFEEFIESLENVGHNKIFLTLGNHELWPFEGEKLGTIIEKYKTLLSEKDIYLVQNNLFYLSDDNIYEVTTNELEKIGDDELRQRTRGANLIVFGGIGFSGRNDKFNFYQGIYRNAGIFSREQEIEESIAFSRLHDKISRALYDKNVIVFTHMPVEDWLDNNLTERFVYVNGHNHNNYFFDDGNIRIYADNQIGYKQKNVFLKEFSVNYDYDWFCCYKDGIHEINKEDYVKFYRGINQYTTINRAFEKIYMLKQEGSYMFFLKSSKGTLNILNGGAIKKTNGQTLEYYYENLSNYSKSVKLFLSKFDDFQKKVSRNIKKIGGEGSIHGCIIDIDYYNHVYINPIDGKITPYYAESITSKKIYKNLPSLLKNRRPELYLNYQKMIGNSSLKDTLSLMLFDENLPIINKTTFDASTEIYRISRIIKGLQYTSQHNVVRLWNDAILENVSEENGRKIVDGIVYPEVTQKRIEAGRINLKRTRRRGS